MPTDYGGSNVDDLLIVSARVATERFEGLQLVDSVALHQHALRALDECAPSKGAFEAVVLAEAQQDDLECAFEGARIGIDDVGEDAALGGFTDERRVRRRENRDHGTLCFPDNLRDQVEGVTVAFADRDERDIRTFPCGCGADARNVDLCCDRLVPDSTDDPREQGQPLGALVRDQDSQELAPTIRIQHLCPFRSIPSFDRLSHSSIWCGPGRGLGPTSAPPSLTPDPTRKTRAADRTHPAMVALVRFGQVTDVVDQVQPLILLAAMSNLLLQELEREEHQHLANDRLKTDLRAFAARVEDELDGLVARRGLHLADDCGSAMTDD